MLHIVSVTLPESGIDVPGTISGVIAAMGPIAATALGGYLAFLLVKMGMAWAKKIKG